MTPEQWSRRRVYDPHFDNPDPPLMVEKDYGKIERRLALVFLLLAAVAIGIGIGLGLPR